MTVTDYRTPEQDQAARSERAKRAVENFRRMQPMLNNYARVFTGNKRISIEVSATSNGATDGKKIFFRPPIALGDNIKHIKKMCDKRDPETLLQACPACELREQVLVTIYHEIAHICYDTFAQPSDTDKAALVAQAVEEAGGRYAEHVAARIRRMPKYMTESYMGMAGTVSPYLHTILNALEDARVNNNLFNARRGTKAMFDADTRKVFLNGVECPQPDGSVKYLPWNEREQNLQAILAVFCHASGYDYQDWFIAPVVRALGDTELQDLIAESVASSDIESNYKIAFKVLARLRELGYCVRPDEPEPQSTEPGESDETGESAADPNAGQEDEGGDDSDDADESGTGGAESAPADSGEGEDEDTSEAEADDSCDSPEQDESEADEGSPVAGDQDGDAGDDTGEDDEGLGDDSDSPESPESDSSGGSDPRASADGASGAGTDTDGDDGPESGDADEDSGAAEAAESDTEGSEELETPEREEGNYEDQIDTGADQGKGGIEVIEIEEDFSHIAMGEPEEVDAGLEVFGHHEDKQPTAEELEDIAAVLQAIIQGAYFETPSTTVQGVREHHYGKPVLNDAGENMSTAWGGKLYHLSMSRNELGIDGDFRPAENVLGPALLRLRTVLADNQRAHQQNHLKSGRVNTRVLGRRAPFGDERLFRKKTVPGKRDYFVVIGLDVSGSTMGRNLELIKASAWAQADLLTRMGISFAIYAYSGYHGGFSDYSGGLYLDIYHVKAANEPWNTVTQERLQALGPDGGNLDGHNLEYLRKVCDQSNATDKIIMYFSDGKMPATNYGEELEILQRELVLCKKKGYTVAGVGVRTDSPSRHGLPTVQINDKSEVMLVVRHLQKMLLK